MSTTKVQERYREPIKHAIECHDKALLNRIELEIVRDLRIQPSEDVTIDFDFDGKWKAIGIKEIGRQLAILWSSCGKQECSECDGTGELEAHGNRRSYNMECPACCGEGYEDSATEFRCWTDIDGQQLQQEPSTTDSDGCMTDSSNDPLLLFYKAQREKAKQKEPA